MHKKIWGTFITVLILMIPLLSYQFWYVPNYGGDNYYTFVGDSYREILEKDDSGNDYHKFYYNQKAYNKDGNQKLLKFDSALGRPIKKNNYLKVKYNNKRKQVISWEKISKNEVPKKSLDKILNN